MNSRKKGPIKVLVSKLGLDGHDRGALIICRALRDAGMEVIYSGLFCTPDQVANIAIQEDVDVVAMSLLNGAHMVLFPKVRSMLNKRGGKDILVIGGGIIPQKDKKLLEKRGIHGNFGPGYSSVGNYRIYSNQVFFFYQIKSLAIFKNEN